MERLVADDVAWFIFKVKRQQRVTLTECERACEVRDDIDNTHSGSV